MRDSTDRQRRSTHHPTQREVDEARVHKAMDERRAAVRRWIDDDDDDAACRSID